MSEQSKRPADLSALSQLAPELAELLASLATDVALVVDPSGVIERVVLGGKAPIAESMEQWVGRPWIETVTVETRRKIEDLLSDASSTGVSRLRQVNHVSAGGDSVPVAYTAVRLGRHGPLLAVGRDLRAVSGAQQRFLETQHEMERDYWKLRRAETRYRLLFQVAPDAVCIVDAATFRVLEANRAAALLLGAPLGDLLGSTPGAWVDPVSRTTLDAVMDHCRTGDRAAEALVRMKRSGPPLRVAITPFRAEDAHLLLLRISDMDDGGAATTLGTRIAALVQRTPDAIVITDDSGRVLMANAAFTALAQLPSPEAVVGNSLADWLETPGHGLADLLARTRREGMVRRFTATLHDSAGVPHAVELSATLLPESDGECVGFILRQEGVASARSARDGGTSH